LASVEPALALSFPKAHFWPRLLANLIDLVVIAAILNFMNLERFIVPGWVLYRLGMYTWRSTTLGGIVLNLRVQRADGIALDFSTALVRALASLLSLLPLGLGFFWILFNAERDAWHDKISGSYVVQLSPQKIPTATTAPSAPPPADPGQSGPA
jgi:uncharacterized RDD family membrane protein YckC